MAFVLVLPDSVTGDVDLTMMCQIIVAVLQIVKTAGTIVYACWASV